MFHDSKLHLQLVLVDDLFPVLVRLPIRVAAVEDVEDFLLGEGDVELLHELRKLR